MKNNTEIKRTQYTIDQLVNHHLIYTGFTINDENYGVDDAWLISLKHTAFPLENKTILGDFNFKEDGAFRSYFKEDLPNKMQETLNNLNNDNAQNLIRLDDESTPDHHAPYSLMPILKDQDATALMERIKGLKNCNVRAFALFLSGHFLLSYSLGSDLTDRFKEDCDTLKSLKELTDKEVENMCGIRKWAFLYLQKVLNGCIQRCEGKRGAMMEYM